jgi:linoleoyl-CoA desaturase
MNIKRIKFGKPQAADFYSTVRDRVNNYFVANNISEKGDWRMVLKTIAMFMIYLVPFTLLFTGWFGPWGFLGLWLLMGVGKAGIGLSVMHDANHGSYSNNPKINDIVSHAITFVGGSSLNWKIQHNVLHHTYTNIDGHDEDIHSLPFMRFSPNQPLYKAQRFQHIYAWFLYGLMTIFWVSTKDFSQLKRYEDKGLLSSQKASLGKELVKLAFHKVLYFSYVLVLPMLFTNQPWWLILGGFFLMHYVAGFILSVVFQPAHVINETSFPQSDDTGNVENTWAVHQLYTTANFAQDNRLLSWYVGGLNYQVEHHLFPMICHIHYRKISKIVRETAAEFNLPYLSEKSFTSALINHGKMLKRLGTEPPLKVAAVLSK